MRSEGRTQKTTPLAWRRARVIAAWAVLLALASGCASLPREGGGDPLEPVNRPIFRFNDALDKAVVLVGQGRKFELWNKDNWEQMVSGAAPLSAGGLPAELEGFSL